MAVSVPEKTFEHWLSTHLTYRYRAKVTLWWPSSGEDISVSDLPRSPGKQFWLEVKTATWEPSARVHSLKVNLWQLWKYGDNAHNPSGIPDYYVFPAPPFNGHITDPAQPWLAGRNKSWIGFQSKSGDSWFARWTWVVPGHELRRILRSELAAWAAAGSRKKAEIEFATVAGGSLKWKMAPSTHGRLKWHEFLSMMDHCGRPGWGALIAIPPTPSGKSRPPVSGPIIKQVLKGLSERDAELRRRGERPDPDFKRELVFWRPGEEGEYVPLDSTMLAVSPLPHDGESAAVRQSRALITLRYDAIV